MHLVLEDKHFKKKKSATRKEVGTVRKLGKVDGLQARFLGFMAVAVLADEVL